MNKAKIVWWCNRTHLILHSESDDMFVVLCAKISCDSFCCQLISWSFRPRRTRTSSGSVVRIFRGELVGLLGGTLSAQGRDKRILIKEYSGKLALGLARAELSAIGRMQSFLLEGDESARLGEWIQSASSRSSTQLRADCSNVAKLHKSLSKASFLGILGECCSYLP